MTDVKTAIGLMSGTSMDGVDVALLRTDGRDVVERGPSASVPYDSRFRGRLKQALTIAANLSDRTARTPELADIERELTLLHILAVRQFLNTHSLQAQSIDLIGFHGQTVLHRPDQGLTIQIGDGHLLARGTGIATVFDMRANDMEHGGQGAPLIPVYHQALALRLAGTHGAELPVALVNIGGISNMTCVGDAGELTAFDSGPGNTLIDQWVEAHTGAAYDANGDIASTGQINNALAKHYLAHPFFTANVRRSLDRNDFRPPAKGDVSLKDGARTLAYVTASAIVTLAAHLPQSPKTFIISGGGRLNRVIMQDLAELAAARGAKVIAADEAGLDGDAMEAEAWAYLTVRSVKGLPLTFPGTTGVSTPVSGGVLVLPDSLSCRLVQT